MIDDAHLAATCRQCGVDEIGAVPNVPAVFLLWAEEGAPYLARTALLHRRLARLLRERERPSRLLNLRGVIHRIEYWLTGSRLESSMILYKLAKRHFPDAYQKIIKLRMPSYVKLTLANQFPRTLVTTRMGGGRGLYFGPFRTRAGAEQFDAQALDLFQIRRCQENLEPRTEHPGCIYGEMGMCLRPCQQVVGPEEYASEVTRLEQFLSTSGASLLESAANARDRSSQELDFEQAARQHKKYERIQQVLALRDELARDSGRLHGVAVTPSSSEVAVMLWFLVEGRWADGVEFPLAPGGGEMIPMDRRLREVIAALPQPRVTVAERQEHLALLARWYYSSWRDGEWLEFDSMEKAPYRRIVNAISRIAKGRVGSNTRNEAPV